MIKGEVVIYDNLFNKAHFNRLLMALHQKV